jgi:dCTP deaminase
MILTYREISIALDCRQLIIDPRPAADSLSSTSVDLTLDATGLEWQATGGFQIRPGHEKYRYTEAMKHQKQIAISGYVLKPQGFLLAWSAERIELPIESRLAARVEGKSSLARLGIGVHVTAPTIHAGFKGPIQLEMFNFGPHDLVLDAGMKICQLIIEQTAGTPEKGYRGQFLGQKAGHT